MNLSFNGIKLGFNVTWDNLYPWGIVFYFDLLGLIFFLVKERIILWRLFCAGRNCEISGFAIMLLEVENSTRQISKALKWPIGNVII